MGRRAIVLLVALILAGLAAWAVWNFLDGVRSEAAEDQIQVTVFRAANQIDEGADGTILLSSPTLIVESTEEQEDLPEGAITTEEQLNNVLSGTVAAGPIAANSVLTVQQWTAITVDVTPMAERIPSGKQAMTIGLDNIRGVNGFVEAGDRINLIITMDLAVDVIPAEFPGITVDPTDPDPEAGEEEATTETITYTRFVLQGIPVLAVGRDIRPEEDAPTVVEVEPTDGTTTEGDGTTAPEDDGNATVFTVEVTPEQAERMAFAFENGSIWMTLVPADFVEVETDGVIVNTLFGGDLLADIFEN
jgi:Flp pilus assembly protein CpaB